MFYKLGGQVKKHSLDILIIINIILALFLFFGDKFITSINWDIFGSIATGISVGDIATITSAIIMACTFFQIKAQQKQQEEANQY